jgi:hypothetical protein
VGEQPDDLVEAIRATCIRDVIRATRFTAPGVSPVTVVVPFAFGLAVAR